MENLTYNESCDRMESVSETGTISTSFLVPSSLRGGDCLMPLHLEALAEKADFFFLGRYNASRDQLEFVLAGPRGYSFQVILGDYDETATSNQPSWQIITKGCLRTDMYQLNAAERTIDFVMTKLMSVVGHDVSGTTSDYHHDAVGAEAFAKEKVILVPMSMLRFPEERRIHGHQQEQQQQEQQQDYKDAWSPFGDGYISFSRCCLDITVLPKSGPDCV